MSDAVVSIAAVSKSFGRLKALDEVYLEVRPGEIYGLLGPNGSGKTTLIRMLVGLILPDLGTVTVLGTRMPEIGILGRIGYMTQAAALYPDLSVLENVRFFAAICGAEAGVEESLRFVELWDRRDSPILDLSGGMRQRASLACAIVHKPSLLLLDEPTVGIDPQLRVQFWDSFREMTRHGVSIVVSSHVMDEAERCDRLGMMLFGKLLAEGSVAELKQKTGAANLEQAFLTFSGPGR
ncbi:MAG TPA: ABC transporter ATP-binding protein [Candidatus Dormibacteraeota bacterium]|nr:ABC transporter ATP-binding protein [Candidatus Dormibacteraeota bacterium]